MVVRARPARVNEAHLIDMHRRLRKQIAAPCAALPVLLEFKWRGHQRPHRAREKAYLRIKPIQRLAIPLLQLRFVIPRVHLRRPTIGKDPNDRLRLPTRLHRHLRRKGIRCRLQHRRQSQHAKATARTGEPFTTRVRQCVHISSRRSIHSAPAPPGSNPPAKRLISNTRPRWRVRRVWGRG